MKRIEQIGLFAMFNSFSFGRIGEGETTSYFNEFFHTSSAMTQT